MLELLLRINLETISRATDRFAVFILEMRASQETVETETPRRAPRVRLLSLILINIRQRGKYNGLFHRRLWTSHDDLSSPAFPFEISPVPHVGSHVSQLQRQYNVTSCAYRQSNNNC